MNRRFDIWPRTGPLSVQERAALALMFRAGDRLLVATLVALSSVKYQADPILGAALLESRGWIDVVDDTAFGFTERFRIEAPQFQTEEARKVLVAEAEAYDQTVATNRPRYSAQVLFVSWGLQALRRDNDLPLEYRASAAKVFEDLLELLECSSCEWLDELKSAIQSGDKAHAMRLAGDAFEEVPRAEVLVVLERHEAGHLLQRPGEVSSRPTEILH